MFESTCDLKGRCVGMCVYGKPARCYFICVGSWISEVVVFRERRFLGSEKMHVLNHITWML